MDGSAIGVGAEGDRGIPSQPRGTCGQGQPDQYRDQGRRTSPPEQGDRDQHADQARGRHRPLARERRRGMGDQAPRDPDEREADRKLNTADDRSWERCAEPVEEPGRAEHQEDQPHEQRSSGDDVGPGAHGYGHCAEGLQRLDGHGRAVGPGDDQVQRTGREQHGRGRQPVAHDQGDRDRDQDAEVGDGAGGLVPPGRGAGVLRGPESLRRRGRAGHLNPRRTAAGPRPWLPPAAGPRTWGPAGSRRTSGS